MRPRQAVRRKRLHAENTKVAIQQGDRDREPHAERVNGTAALEQHARLVLQPGSSEEAAPTFGARFRDLDGEGLARKYEGSTAHGRGTLAPPGDRLLKYAPRMDDASDAPAGNRFRMEAMVSFAALLSAIPAVLVKLGLDRMIDGLTGNGALPPRTEVPRCSPSESSSWFSRSSWRFSGSATRSSRAFALGPTTRLVPDLPVKRGPSRLDG
jgi:hypothetical protein